MASPAAVTPDELLLQAVLYVMQRPPVGGDVALEVGEGAQPLAQLGRRQGGERTELVRRQQLLDPGGQVQLHALGRREERGQAAGARAPAVLGEDLGQQLDQGFGAGILQAEVAPLGLGHDEVDPGLRQPPQVGKLRLELGAGIPLGPQATEGQTLEAFEVVGAQSIDEIQVGHRREGTAAQPPDTGGIKATSSPGCSTRSAAAGERLTQTEQLGSTLSSWSPWVAAKAASSRATVVPAAGRMVCAAPEASRAAAKKSTVTARFSSISGPGPASPGMSVPTGRSYPARLCEDGRVGRLLVVRHAQSVWNAAGRWQGWSDAPLSELGQEQARQAGRALAAAGTTPDAMASSDLARARMTAALIGAEVGYGGPMTVDPGLREQDLGEWNGLTSDEIATVWPSQLDARRAGRLGEVPGGEEATVFAARCLGALRSLAGAGAGETVVVAHGGVIIALERAMGVWRDGNSHPHLGGWWVESRGALPDLELVAVRKVDLLAPQPETVTGPA